MDRGISPAPTPRSSRCPKSGWGNRGWFPLKAPWGRWVIRGEPPGADPHAGWCGGRVRESPAYPIRRQPSLLLALHDNIRGLKRSRMRETHPHSDRPELLRPWTKCGNHGAVRLARSLGAGKYDARVRRRVVDVQCDLHEENLIARKRPENGAVVVIDADAVVRQEI